MIHALRFEDPAEFRARVAPFLLADEAMHTLPLGLVTRLATLGPAEDHDPFLMLAEDDGLVVAMMLRMATRFPLVVSRIVQDHALGPMVDAAAALDPPAVGVAGPKPWGERLAARLAPRLGVTSRLVMAQRTFRIDEVQPPEGVPGALRTVTVADRGLLVAWMKAFGSEALPHEAMNAAEAVDRYFSRPDIGLCLWEVEGHPVSMAGYGGRTPNSERIGPVYTPPELRGRGYASGAVAALSQRRLDDGRAFLTLFTDMANPTSNHIYTHIGYLPVCDAEDYRFDPAAGATVRR